MDDLYEKHRVAARERYGRMTPYRLGIMVGESGEDLPNPYRKRIPSAGAKGYEEGASYGRKRRAELRAALSGAGTRTASDE